MNRRRRYSPHHIRVLQMLVRLRRTGMPTAEVREFSSLLGEGASTHGRRLALLAAHRERIESAPPPGRSPLNPDPAHGR